MSSEPIISIRNASKFYRSYPHPLHGLISRVSGGKFGRHKEFHALNDINLDIQKGETVGIIGCNGSGKSTLLQLICGIRKPTSGSVTVKGRISALLELGSGFHPEFTGRENVFMQGAIIGMTLMEMEARFADIAAFADIGDFIEQPVKTYSSGMYVRLAFAVAISVEPDILVVDEALAVGDIAFQHKCRKKLQQLIDTGTSLLMVSHDRNAITASCNRCVLLDHGSCLMDGLPSDVFDYYHALIATKNHDLIVHKKINADRVQVTSGTGEAHIESIQLLDSTLHETTQIDVGAPVTLVFVVRTHQLIPHLVLGFSIRDQHGKLVFGTNTLSYGISQKNVPPNTRLTFRLAFHANIGQGHYSVSTTLVSTGDRFTHNYESRELAYFFEVKNANNPAFGGTAWLIPKFTVDSDTTNTTLHAN